ncbi:MAG: uracil phosphoribosyltransferase [Fulvivirga sp.]
MLKILNHNNSIANHFLYEMRHKVIQKDRAKFRNNMKKLGIVMGYEISMVLDYKKCTVNSPLGSAAVELLHEQPVIISILRAAIPFMEGFVEIFDQSDVGFIGAYREEDGEEIEIKLNYQAVPSIEGRNVILVDPMLATGKSIVKSINNLVSNGLPHHIHIATAVAAPEGIEHISRYIKCKHTIWTGALDKKLNSNAYIVPGLGDAGDLSYGPKL